LALDRLLSVAKVAVVVLREAAVSGSGSGRTDGPDETLVTRGDSYAYDPYEDADL
jgi:hypothetical protein